MIQPPSVPFCLGFLHRTTKDRFAFLEADLLVEFGTTLVSSLAREMPPRQAVHPKIHASLNYDRLDVVIAMDTMRALCHREWSDSAAVRDPYPSRSIFSRCVHQGRRLACIAQAKDLEPGIKYVEQNITSALGPPQIKRPSVDLSVLSTVVLSQCPREYRSCIVCCLWSRDLVIPSAEPNHRRWDLTMSSGHGNGTSLLRQCKGHSEEPGRPMSREAEA